MCTLSNLHPLDPSGVAKLLNTARAFQHAAFERARLPSLVGRHLGLLCLDPGAPCARRFRLAAESLKAHVSHVPPTLTVRSSPAEIRRFCLALCRLYSGVECQDIPSSLVLHIATQADIPVFQGLATPDHPLRRMVVELAPYGSDEDKWLWLIQSTLIEHIA